MIVLVHRQLRAAYRPELALSQVVFKSAIKSGAIVPELWTEKFHSEPTEASGNIGRLVLPIRNIGLGTANEVEVKWSFPMRRAVQQVSEYSGDAKVITYNRRSGWLSIKLAEDQAMGASWLGNRRRRIDYLIPASIESEPTLLAVPVAYANVVSAMTFFYSKMTNPQKELRVPELRLDLKYRDIGRSTCRVSFAIDCEIAIYNQDGEIVRGYLRGKRVG